MGLVIIWVILLGTFITYYYATKQQFIIVYNMCFIQYPHT